MDTTDETQTTGFTESLTKPELASNGQAASVAASVDNPPNVEEGVRSCMPDPEQDLTVSLNVKSHEISCTNAVVTDPGEGDTPDGFATVPASTDDGIETEAAEEVRESIISIASSAFSASGPEERLPANLEQETVVQEAVTEVDSSHPVPALMDEPGPATSAEKAEMAPGIHVDGTESVPATNGNEEVQSGDVYETEVIEKVVEQDNIAEESSKGMIPEAGTTVTEQSVKSEEAVVAKGEPPEILLPPEVDTVQVLPHWQPKPSAHVTSIGGQVTEEELRSLFGVYGQISTISFENERHDAAIVRYDHSAGDPEMVVTKIREYLNNTKLGDRTLIVEPFRLDSLLFVGNLTPDIDDSLLCKMFEPHGMIERAFVLCNSEGRSKGYGFIEYGLKSQATSAKMAMGNINMDGRVLRVEWSDCRRVADMFSSVLFIDRLPRDCLHVEQSLRTLFGQYGKVKDCYLAIGINQQLRGFGFIDFYHSICADNAHIGLDGHELEGSNIRVSFANPSKSAQSYKLRFGNEAAQAAMGGRGAAPDQAMQPLVPGTVMGRGHMRVPLLSSRYMGSSRPGMLGMGIGMQFGRGTMDRGLVSHPGSGATGMLGPGSMASGMMGRSPGMLGNAAPRAGTAAGGNFSHGSGMRVPNSQGAMAITPAAIVQVATAQAKAREEEAKAKAEAAKQSMVKQAYPQQQSSDQYQRYQQNYYQQQIPASSDQQYKQSDGVNPYQHGYQQPSQEQQSQYHSWSQGGQQTQQSYNYTQPAQSHIQPQQTAQPTQQSQATESQQQYGYTQQYGQQYSQQTLQTYAQTYGQPSVGSGQQYQQMAQQQLQSPYVQQGYAEQYSQQQQQQQYSQQQQYGQQQQYSQQQQQQQQQAQEQGQTGFTAAATAGVASVQDPSQQQAYAAYYQQQSQQGITQPETATATGNTTPSSLTTAVAAVGAPAATTTATGLATSSTSTAQQSYEAQWAAYYASQTAYQQAGYGQQQPYSGVVGSGSSYYEQNSSVDVGQKRTADQMDSGSQAQQVTYNYTQAAPTASVYSQQAPTGYSQQAPTGYSQQGATSYTQQVASGFAQQQAASSTPYQQQTSGAYTVYQQQPGSSVSAYQQQSTTTVPYQQPVAGTTAYYQLTSYGQSTVAGTDSYQQQPATVTGTYSVGAPDQTGVVGLYDYNKRPRY